MHLQLVDQGAGVGCGCGRLDFAHADVLLCLGAEIGHPRRSRIHAFHVAHSFTLISEVSTPGLVGIVGHRTDGANGCPGGILRDLIALCGHFIQDTRSQLGLEVPELKQ